MSVIKHPLLSVLAVFLSLTLLPSCHPRSCLLEPKICYTLSKDRFENFPSPFKPLTDQEAAADWGKELKIAIAFGKELDLYRAITGFKRALVLIPQDQQERRKQAEYGIIKSYYLGDKYEDALDAFEHSSLTTANSSFPAFRELLIVLYDIYSKTERPEKARIVLSILEKGDPETASDMILFTLIDTGDLRNLSMFASNREDSQDVTLLLKQYCCSAKSVRKSQALNAVLPGAGYFYVGQKRTALTSLLLNTAFVAAAWHFFDKGNWGAGFITASFEAGWYFGGINGAGLAAKQYNQTLYENLAKEVLVRNNLFPILQIQTSF